MPYYPGPGGGSGLGKFGQLSGDQFKVPVLGAGYWYMNVTGTLQRLGGLFFASASNSVSGSLAVYTFDAIAAVTATPATGTVYLVDMPTGVNVTSLQFTSSIPNHLSASVILSASDHVYEIQASYVSSSATPAVFYGDTATVTTTFTIA